MDIGVEYMILSICYDINTIASVVSAIAAVAGAFISVIVYSHSVNRERKSYTIQEFSKIRDKYRNLSPKAKDKVSDEERVQYLREMERFCTGINNGIFDVKIIKQMDGRLLVKQYDRYMKDIVNSRRNGDDEKWKYCEYEKFITKLKKKYRD